ncbi:DNA-binding protein YbiB [Azohydromonas caseinilytica]|uniref:DNA-binding protein YbiB n=1 Tax=Azohydromonas caseinilytica TaxID=2728836 RepID=A0A848F7E9_9BURK|nr:DNA-binding protein YbiB [Azohydromonas caseinilytica]NML14645.1 DNA-binding protein YbiB [Azohydromonas caseinilytica]
MSISSYIKEIGRGAAGARSLSAEQAQDLMAQVLDGSVSDLEIGAFAIAMRMKGETAVELAGFLAAVHERCVPIPSDRPVVMLPSYNGARRLPNLTPLLALRLAQEGARVLVHGPIQDPKRVTSAEVFHDLGLPVAQGVKDVERAWARHEPAFLRIDALCPSLARLLDVRWVLGLRNSGHTIAKMLDPVSGARGLRVCNYTHPEFGQLLAQYAQAEGADMLLLRGTEGEPVADARRLPRMDLTLRGVPHPALSCAPQEGALAQLPVLPRENDAATTALYIQSVLSGEKPAPAPLERQVELLMGALAAMQDEALAPSA